MKIVSLFAGCGGLDLGFEKAGFDVIWANEYDETIHQTYLANHPNTILNTSDIRDLSAEDIPDCDGIIGGPPCQSWSEGGKQLGIEDPRGQLFLEYIRIVGEKRPKFFLIENVQGILEEKHKDSLDGFLASLKALGYNITYELLNACDYKIPQERYRVFFVGIRKDLKNKFRFPDKVSASPITLRQAIGDITETPHFYADGQVTTINTERYNHDVYLGAYDSKYMARNRVRTWDEVSFTMQALAKNAPQHPQAPKMTYITPQQRIFAKGYEHLYRRLSVRECARIQTFPDSFRFFYEDVKDGYKMVGNAVPPRLAWYIATQIKQAFIEEFGGAKLEKVTPIGKTSVADIAKQYPSNIVENKAISQHLIDEGIDPSKNVLISLVKHDNTAIFLYHSAKIYYTGSKFPSTIALNKLYYFMPYVKGKGIKDLYLIKIARVGTKQEVYPECKDNDFRLVFELEYIKPLFSTYIPIHLDIWYTFTDTKLSNILNVFDDNKI